jgi:hypothetical protein
MKQLGYRFDQQVYVTMKQLGYRFGQQVYIYATMKQYNLKTALITYHV